MHQHCQSRRRLSKPLSCCTQRSTNRSTKQRSTYHISNIFVDGCLSALRFFVLREGGLRTIGLFRRMDLSGRQNPSSSLSFVPLPHRTTLTDAMPSATPLALYALRSASVNRAMRAPSWLSTTPSPSRGRQVMDFELSTVPGPHCAQFELHPKAKIQHMPSVNLNISIVPFLFNHAMQAIVAKRTV